MPASSFIINRTNSDLPCSTAAHSPVSHQVIPIASNRQTHKCISDKPEVVMGEMVASGSGSFMMEGKSPVSTNFGLITEEAAITVSEWTLWGEVSS